MGLIKKYCPIVWRRCSSYRWRPEFRAKCMVFSCLRPSFGFPTLTLSKSRPKYPRRWWVRPLLQNDDKLGPWYNIIQIIRKEDPEAFYDMFRMTPEAFDKLLGLVEPHISKKSWRKAISPGERLAITLRFLATGQSFKQLMQYFLVGEQTMSKIVFETTSVIWNILEPIVFDTPSQDTWLRVAAEYEAMWQIPHCIGATDGKHVRVQQPPRAGSRYYNYKGFHSVILIIKDPDRRHWV